MSIRELSLLLSAVAPEFASVPKDTLKIFLRLVEPMISKNKFGKLYEQALVYLIAHRLQMSGYGQTEDGGGGLTGGISTKDKYGIASLTEGSTSISFNAPQTSNGDQDAEYALTTYGTQFLSLRESCIIPITISGGRETRCQEE